MKATRKTIATLIEKREAFENTSGTVTGRANLSKAEVNLIVLNAKNQLNNVENSRLRIDNDTDGIAYLVMSYDTPIAWETNNGHVYKVEQKFPQTTSKHQGLLYLFHEEN